MIPGHQCLTQEAVFGLLKLERPQAPTMAEPVLRTLQGLDRCEQCWKTIENVRQQCARHPI